MKNKTEIIFKGRYTNVGFFIVDDEVVIGLEDGYYNADLSKKDVKKLRNFLNKFLGEEK